MNFGLVSNENLGGYNQVFIFLFEGILVNLQNFLPRIEGMKCCIYFVTGKYGNYCVFFFFLIKIFVKISNLKHILACIETILINLFV